MQQLVLQDKSILAYHKTFGTGPGVIFMGGYMSDMTGTKATALEKHAQEKGYGFVRFDYSGHGRSSGNFRDGTIGRWRDDALAIFDSVTEGPQILVGSSMGGWIACLVALMRPERVHALVGIAAAPDFTREIMVPGFSAEERAMLQTQGYIEQPSEYSETPYVVTRRLVEEAEAHLLLHQDVPITCPVRLIHGDNDVDVPWQLSHKLMNKILSNDVTLTLVKGGDHRLSTPADLQRLTDTIDRLRNG
jgi:pimeloyl-ACP methyl ester carboxylesterase